MSDNININTNTNAENADNVSQNEVMDEALGNFLNTDDSGHAGGSLSESNTEEISRLQAELDETKDKHIRLIAEFDNFRRRNAKEKIELTQTAGKEIVTSLLVVLDDMGRAEKQMDNSQDLTAIKEGVMLVFNKLRSTLLHRGLKAMETGNGEFDPDVHEAITEIPAPNEEMKGKIIDTVEPGYYLNDKLIRHAKVVVGK